MTAKYSKCLKSTTLWGLLCMLVLVTTGIIKIQGLHLCKYGMMELIKHVDIMLIGCTPNATKMTNQQVLLNSSRQHHIAVLQRGLGNQYGE